MDKAMSSPSNPKIDSPKVDKCLSRSRVYRTFETAVNPIISLKGLCHPTRMREPMKTNLKKLARLFQVLSEILEGCFYLPKSQPSFDS